MEESIKITKRELENKLGNDHFDRLYHDWINTGLITQKGSYITFPQESKHLLDKYIDFWGDFQKSDEN